MQQPAERPGALRPRLAPRVPTWAALELLGWSFPSPFVFVDRHGERLRLLDEAPRTIKLVAYEAYDHWAASRSSLCHALNGLPDLEPLRNHLRCRSRKGAPGASLRAMAEGGW